MFFKHVMRYASRITALAALTALALFDIPICYAKGEIHPRVFVRQEYNDNRSEEHTSELQSHC